jgi:hypothetical protein
MKRITREMGDKEGLSGQVAVFRALAHPVRLAAVGVFWKGRPAPATWPISAPTTGPP